MKKTLLSIFLLQSVVVFAQVNKWHTIKLDSAMGVKIIGKSHDYYIESVVDKRKDKSKLGWNFHEGKYHRLHFKKDSSALEIQQFFNKILPKEEGKKAIQAEINFFQMGNNFLSGISNDGFVDLDIDFYDKDEFGQKRLISHYHGSVINADDRNVPRGHVVRTYFAFRWALKNLDKATNQVINLDSMIFFKPNYVPKKGLYLSLMDYRRNTPLVTELPYKINKGTYNSFGEEYEDSLNLTIKFLNDSLSDRRFMGYSDGNYFYLTTQSNKKTKIFSGSCTKGRYLFVPKSFIPRRENDNTNLPYMGGGFIGGLIVGAANAAINSGSASTNLEYIILDTETGEIVNFDTPHFQSQMPKNYTDEMKHKARKKEVHLTKLIQIINENYEK